MAGTPELEAPAADIQQQQAAPIPTPPPGAFTGEVVGKVINQIATEEYQRSVEAMANQATADFQNFALDKRVEYLNKYGGDAIAAYPETMQALRDKQQEILNNLTSRHARRLTFDSTERVARLVQESVDSHFVQQNKVVKFGSYQKVFHANVRLAAGLVTQGKLDDAFKMVDDAYDFGLKQYHGLGFSLEDAQRMAEGDRAAMAVGVVQALSKMGAQ